MITHSEEIMLLKSAECYWAFDLIEEICQYFYWIILKFDKLGH